MNPNQDIRFDTPIPSSPRGVDAASTASDAHGSRPPKPCLSVFRDALKDLVSHDGMTSIRAHDPKCPYAIALKRNRLVEWVASPAPGKWVITPEGWRFLESRTQPQEETL